MKHNVVKSTLLRFAAVMLLVMGTVPASAQYYMNVIKKNGETVKVAVDDIDSIAFFGKFTLSVNLPKADSIFLSDNTSVMDDFEYYYIDTIRVNPFKLVHSVASWGKSFGMAFTYSSLTDTITPGYTNNSAITGQGVSTNGYFTVNTGGDMYGIDTEITFEGGKAYKAKECYVTNSTYAYRAIKDHDDGGFGGVKEWTADDVFTLTITGYNGSKETGHVDFKLADGLNIVNTWQKIDLTELGEVTTLHFALSSTDNGSWGMNTPAYFCLDQLTVIEE